MLGLRLDEADPDRVSKNLSHNSGIWEHVHENTTVQSQLNPIGFGFCKQKKTQVSIDSQFTRSTMTTYADKDVTTDTTGTALSAAHNELWFNLITLF